MSSWKKALWCAVLFLGGCFLAVSIGGLFGFIIGSFRWHLKVWITSQPLEFIKFLAALVVAAITLCLVDRWVRKTRAKREAEGAWWERMKMVACVYFDGENCDFFGKVPYHTIYTERERRRDPEKKARAVCCAAPTCKFFVSVAAEKTGEIPLLKYREKGGSFYGPAEVARKGFVSGGAGDATEGNGERHHLVLQTERK